MDITIQSIKCIGWQKEFVNMFLNLQPNDKFIIKASRQKGKSTIMEQAILYYAFNNSGSTSYFISPTNNQARKVFNDIKKLIGNSPLTEKMNETTCEIRFRNGSEIGFKSAEMGDNLRGYTVKNGALFIDEAAFIKDDTISLLLPYITVSQSPIIMVSTPRRKSGTFYNWYEKALNGEKGFKYLDVNDFDNSFFINEDQINSYKSIMTPEKFKNEILGLFSDNNEGLFGDYQSLYKLPDDLNPVYGGIDFSTTGNDATVISCFNKNKEQCIIWYDRNEKDPVKRVEMMADFINSHPTFQSIYAETNSMGSIYISLLRKLLHNPNIIKDFTTTNNSKKDIIENLVKLMGRKEISLLDDKQQDYELNIFICIPLSKGNYTYGNDPKASNGHDDCIMATAMACKNFDGSQGCYMLGHTHKRN